MNKLISLDAFKKALERIKDYVDSKLATAGGKADWNAQEDEVGYIENRTHYMDYNLDAITPIVNVPLLRDFGEYHTFEFNYIKLPQDWFKVENDTIKLLKPLIFKVDTPDYSDEWNYDDYNDHDIPYKTSFGDSYESNCDIGGDNAFIIYIHDNDVYKDGLYFDLGIVSKTYGIKVKHLGVKTLDDKYLPDTILKTTPQTLIDNDKNQALSNLGIDPVFWKYMCNPCIVPTSVSSYTLPSDLQDIIVDESGDLIPSVVLKCIIFNIDDAYLIPTGARPNTIHSHNYCTAIYSQGTLTFTGL